VYLQYKDLGLAHEASALVSFEQGGDLLDADLAILGVHLVLLPVTQEDAHEAVRVQVVRLPR